MSTLEMKWKITTSLDKLSETALEEVLNIVNEKKSSGSVRYDINTEIDLILREDAALLKRLAE